MKTIKLLVEIEAPDNYPADEPDWLIADAVSIYCLKVSIKNIKVIEDETGKS